jgi:hypothetical protein
MGNAIVQEVVEMLGGTLEMDLTYINLPINDGTISHLLNVSIKQ